MAKYATDAATSCPRAVVPVCAADMCCAWPWMEGTALLSYVEEKSSIGNGEKRSDAYVEEKKSCA